ncbi:hypothetical protein [Vibrio paucivorans]
MAKEQSVEQDFDLSEDRPLAGEVRTFPLGEAWFFSPKPLPSARVTAGGLGESEQILEINDTYMDLGQSNHGKAFQVQSVMTGNMFMLCVAIAVFLSVALSNQAVHGGFLKALLFDLKEGGLVALGALLFPLSAGWYAIISTSLKKAREKPIRFHRQRREVCYFKTGSDTPIIVPWEEVVSWVSVYKGFTGSAVVSNVTFGIALPDATGQDYWMFRKPVGLMEEGQLHWEVIRCYMEEGPEYWAKPAGNENRATFDERRAQIIDDFKSSPKPLFAMSMSNPTASYFNLFGYYVFNILSWWKLPYLVAEWDSKISMAKFPPEIDEWSKPLSEEEWAKPSDELRKQKAIAEKLYKSGGNLKDLQKLIA